MLHAPVVNAIMKRTVSALGAHGQLLVVGGKDSNFTVEQRGHDRVVYWDSTDPSIERRVLPRAAQAVVFTRFIGHKLQQRIKNAAVRQRAFVYPLTMNTGQIRELIELLPAREARREAPEPERTMSNGATIPSGKAVAYDPPCKSKPSLSLWVFDHADFSQTTKRGGLAKEARRLVPLARSAGFADTTEGSVAFAIRAHQIKMGYTPKARKLRKQQAVVTPPAAENGSALLAQVEVPTLLGNHEARLEKHEERIAGHEARYESVCLLLRTALSMRESGESRESMKALLRAALVLLER